MEDIMKTRFLHIMLLFIAAAALQTTTSAWGMKERRNGQHTSPASSSSSASAAAARKTITEKEIVQKWRNDIQLAIQVRNEALPSVAEHLEEPLRTAIDNEDLAALQNELRRAECNDYEVAKVSNLYVQAMNYALERNDLGEFAHQFFEQSGAHDHRIIAGIAPDRVLHLMRAVFPYSQAYCWQRLFLEKGIRVQDIPVVTLLLSNGFHPDYRNNDDPLFLTLAAQTGNIGIAYILRQFDAHLHYVGGSTHPEPMRVAAERGDAEMLRTLVRNDPTERHHALRAALNANKPELISYLLIDGADPCTRLPWSGLTPLEAAQPGEAKRLIQEAINKRQQPEQ